jgi:hypothetical protein
MAFITHGYIANKCSVSLIIDRLIPFSYISFVGFILMTLFNHVIILHNRASSFFTSNEIIFAPIITANKQQHQHSIINNITLFDDPFSSNECTEHTLLPVCSLTRSIVTKLNASTQRRQMVMGCMYLSIIIRIVLLIISICPF